jgi:Cu-Zn family superoxide dismutase
MRKMPFMFKTQTTFGAVLFLSLSGCQVFQDTPTATSVIQSKSGSNLNGSINFSQSGKQVLVTGTFSGLKPNSEHGIHIHEKGDCSASDAMSALGHYNPTNSQHGSVQNASHHAGDMPNIMSDASGNANYRATLTDFSLVGDQTIIGRAVVVHRDPDDYKSQPAGNSGPRIGCGLIR